MKWGNLRSNSCLCWTNTGYNIATWVSWDTNTYFKEINHVHAIYVIFLRLFHNVYECDKKFYWFWLSYYWILGTNTIRWWQCLWRTPPWGKPRTKESVITISHTNSREGAVGEYHLWRLPHAKPWQVDQLGQVSGTSAPGLHPVSISEISSKRHLAEVRNSSDRAGEIT